MRFVKVRYDHYNRQFNITERHSGTEPDDGPTFVLDDFLNEDFLSTADLDVLDIEDTEDTLE